MPDSSKTIQSKNDDLFFNIFKVLTILQDTLKKRTQLEYSFSFQAQSISMEVKKINYLSF
ncbi:hypothetical protein BV372_21245 [Nostoc sp. T09]|nr:hypothetical protein BV372_21245 [Nostoc sp. T09]